MRKVMGVTRRARIRNEVTRDRAGIESVSRRHTGRSEVIQSLRPTQRKMEK